MNARFSSILLLLFSLSSLHAEEWISHADIARRVLDKFKGIETYSARFQMQTNDGKKSTTMSGHCYYQKPGKIRYEFDQPNGNLIVSDGRILWVFIKRLGAVGKQDLTLKKKNESDSDIFSTTPGPGLSRLFRKYHYKFDKPQQPRKFDDGTFFVLEMEQREKIGGYETILLYIDPSNYLIRKAEATDSYGKRTVISFSAIELDPQLEGKLFQYQPEDNIRIVLNPLVSED